MKRIALPLAVIAGIFAVWYFFIRKKPKTATENSDDIRKQANRINQASEFWRGLFSWPVATNGKQPLATASVNQVYRSFATMPVAPTSLPVNTSSTSFSRKGSVATNPVPADSDWIVPTLFNRN